MVRELWCIGTGPDRNIVVGGRRSRACIDTWGEPDVDGLSDLYGGFGSLGLGQSKRWAVGPDHLGLGRKAEAHSRHRGCRPAAGPRIV